jgi:hypothetical protein
MLLDALSTDLIRSIHFRELLLSIRAQTTNFPDVFTQSNTFWWHTLHALSESALQCLCRVYDKQHLALSLPNLLQLISDNLGYFSIEDFKSRLSGNPFVDSLAEHPRIPDPAQLEIDLSLVSPKDPLVNKLIIWRNNLYGHRSSSSTLESFNNLVPYELTWVEVEELSERALSIYNRYQSLFKANTWSTMFIGKDDFISLLRFAQSGLNQYRKNIDNETAPYINEWPPAHA